MSADPVNQNKPTAFVDYIIAGCQRSKGLAATLSRADNPKTEYQSWEMLVKFHIDLEKPWQRLPYTTIAAAIAKAKVEHNGSVGVGRAIASCYADDNASDQAKAKLRRLLACDTVEEACRILRPLFSLINSKSLMTLNYASLLEQLVQFDRYGQSIKARWAQDFYRRPVTENKQTTKEAAL